MNLLEGFRAQVIAAGSDVALAVLTRMYPVVPPVNPTIPYGVYLRVPGTTHLESHDGPSGMATVRISVTIWSDDASQSYNLAEDIRKRIHRFRGNLGGSGVIIDAVSMAGDYPQYDPKTALYGETRDFLMTYQEAT